MIRYMELFARSKESEGVICLGVLSRNAGMAPDCMTIGPLYRHEVQGYYDYLVSNGFISFVRTDIMQDKDHYLNRYSLFRIKGIEELQKVASDSFIDDPMTIEDLLVLAATTNGIDYPTNIGPSGGNTYLQGAVPVLCFGAAVAAYPVTALPLIVVSTLTAVSAIEDAASFMNDMKTDRPKPSF